MTHIKLSQLKIGQLYVINQRMLFIPLGKPKKAKFFVGAFIILIYNVDNQKVYEVTWGLDNHFEKVAT